MAYHSIKCNNQDLTGKKVLLFLINLVIIYSTLTVSITQAKSDKWDENVRPKLVFDFLNKESTVPDSGANPNEEDPNQSKALNIVLSRRFLFLFQLDD